MRWLQRLWNRWQLRSFRRMAIALPQPFMLVDIMLVDTEESWIYHPDHFFILNASNPKDIVDVYQWILLRLSKDHRDISIVGIVEPTSFLRRRHVHCLNAVLKMLRADLEQIESQQDVLRVDFYPTGPRYAFASLIPVGSLDHEGYSMVSRVVSSRTKGVLLFKTGD